MIAKEIIVKYLSLQLILDVYGENSDWQNDYRWIDGQNTCYLYCPISFCTVTESKLNDAYKIEEF